jgi:hypothetical protein
MKLFERCNQGVIIGCVASGVGEEIVSIADGTSWGRVAADEELVWRLKGGRIAKKASEDNKWRWKRGVDGYRVKYVVNDERVKEEHCVPRSDLLLLFGKMDDRDNVVDVKETKDGKFKRGRVTEINSDGKCTVQYDDNTTKPGIPEFRLRRTELKNGDAVERVFAGPIPQPYSDTHLLVWAICTERKSIARQICKDCDQPMLCAFLAAYLYRQLVKNEEMQAMKNELKNEIVFFDEFAASVLNYIPALADCHKVLSAGIETDPNSRREEAILAKFIDMDCEDSNRIDLALKADNKKFIAHRSVQLYIESNSSKTYNKVWFFWHRFMFASWVVVYAFKACGWGELLASKFANELFTAVPMLVGAFVGARIGKFNQAAHSSSPIPVGTTARKAVGAAVSDRQKSRAFLLHLPCVLPCVLAVRFPPCVLAVFSKCHLWTAGALCTAMGLLGPCIPCVGFFLFGLLGFLVPCWINHATQMFMWVYFFAFVLSEMKQCKAQWGARRKKPAERTVPTDSVVSLILDGVLLGTLLGTLAIGALGGALMGGGLGALMSGVGSQGFRLLWETVFACCNWNHGLAIVGYGAVVGYLKHFGANIIMELPRHPWSPYLLPHTFGAFLGALPGALFGALIGFATVRVVISIQRKESGKCVTFEMLTSHVKDWFNFIDFVIIMLFSFSMLHPMFPLVYVCDYWQYYYYGGDCSWFRMQYQNVLTGLHCANFICCLARLVYMFSYGSHGKVLLTLVLGTWQIVKTQVSYFFVVYLLLVVACLPVANLVKSGENTVWSLIFAKESDEKADGLNFAFFQAFSLFGSVVLMNILGARMTNHHDALDSKSELEWKKMRAVLVREYAKMEGYAPPFNLVHDLHSQLGGTVDEFDKRELNFFGNWSNRNELRRGAKWVVEIITDSGIVPWSKGLGQKEPKYNKKSTAQSWVRELFRDSSNRNDPFLRLVEAERKAIHAKKKKWFVSTEEEEEKEEPPQEEG